MHSSITQKERIISLDIIRGFALFGILLMNVAVFQTLTVDIQIPTYSGLNETITKLIDIFVEKKFFSIFSFLFGAGFFIAHCLPSFSSICYFTHCIKFR